MIPVEADDVLKLLAASDAVALPLWLGGGWAIDARLHRITRPHDDVDIAYPQKREIEFSSLLGTLGPVSFEATNYGFLATVDGRIIDCEPCVASGDAYELEGVPPGGCPLAKQGTIAGQPVRCTSWEAILWDYFHYLTEVPQSAWRAKDFASYDLARAAYGQVRSARLHALFKAQHAD